MVSNIRLAWKILGYQLFRKFGFPKLMPMNITIAVTNKCTSLCKTCNLGRIYLKNPRIADNDLTPEEYKKIFASIGKNNVFWFVFSGAEPFQRKDLVEICKYAYDYCKPNVIVLPTNSLQAGTKERVEELLKHCKGTIINVNLSLDGVGKDHDQIRGIKGNFDLVLKLFRELKPLKQKYSNFELNIHTVVSRYNYEKIGELHKYVRDNLGPDAHITEIAENKAEIENLKLDITPAIKEYEKTINLLSEQLKEEKYKGFTKTKQVSRLLYYELVKKIFKQKTQVIPCYAMINEVQINPLGELWTCSVLGKSSGNLRENNYDFKKVWSNQKSKELRKSIKNKECWCPVANVSYTNMICNPMMSLKIIIGVLFNKIIK
ncbi:MAG: radical SAM protein [Candidatus Nanoarchaeia archaeon]